MFHYITILTKRLNLIQAPSRCPERGQFTKKLPGSDTYFFEKYIPIGIQKSPNEKIRCVAWREILMFLFWAMK